MLSGSAPSRLQSALVSTFQVLPDPLARTLRDRIDPAWIAQALAEGDGISVRRRKMPADVVVWMVLGACLFAGMSFVDVVQQYGLTLLTRRGNPQPLPTSGAIARARQRVGSETLAALFRIATGVWLDRPELQHLAFHGLRACGIDGFTVRVPDTPTNVAAFGKPPSRREEAGYPQARVVCVVDATTHMIVHATPGAYRDAEVPLLADIVPSLPDSAVYILDRNFNAYAQLWRIQNEGTDRHWLVRCKKSMRVKTVRALGDNDDLVEVETSAAARKQEPALPRTFLARRIRYTVKNTEFVVLTSMLDPVRFPAIEIAALYHRRWETEMVVDDLKTEQRGARIALRSKTPDGVLQELYALMLAHNLVRLEMAQVAQLLDVAPIRISYHRAVAAIAHHLHIHSTSPPTKMLYYREFLRAELAYFVLPERRTIRSYPRALKVVVPRYPRKTLSQIGGPH